MRKNVVGLRIREARSKRKEPLSQEEVVARVQAMGVELDQGMLSRIENGERQITDVEIVALSKALGVSIASLFTGARLPHEM